MERSNPRCSHSCTLDGRCLLRQRHFDTLVGCRSGGYVLLGMARTLPNLIHYSPLHALCFGSFPGAISIAFSDCCWWCSDAQHSRQALAPLWHRHCKCLTVFEVEAGVFLATALRACRRVLGVFGISELASSLRGSTAVEFPQKVVLLKRGNLESQVWRHIFASRLYRVC